MGQSAVIDAIHDADSFKGAVLKAVDSLRDQMQPVNADIKKGAAVREEKATAIKMSEISGKISYLVKLFNESRDARTCFAEAIKAVSGDSGLDAAAILKFVAARAGGRKLLREEGRVPSVVAVLRGSRGVGMAVQTKEFFREILEILASGRIQMAVDLILKEVKEK